ncbi:phosphonate C-P lyase system protein PhnH [Iningainema tapete]|uniref:Phosphonate C-P lyase system protein PhnH n=1 Tax=Iningainema tapete BLCC-T55 TaxID=2748662 RepID=A0A8J7C742_9CYAN|nr:phosphonate C-P lyase system protein PhnH [Iningainema tapete]MBD2772711.1 phosphonate C-P lyase system protein PhnH [Iningainema tapete BLCC-T55]
MLKIDTIWLPETQQKIFRNLLHCMSLPGEISDLSEYLNKSSALVGVLATLLDKSVSWSDEDGLVSPSDRYLLQAPTASVETAKFVVRNATNPPESHFTPNLGELPNPETGATIILQGTALAIGNTTLQLSGAGVKGTRLVNLAGFHPEWFRRRHDWNTNFPLGVDVILVDSTRIMALPRTTHIQMSYFSSTLYG